MSITTKNIGKVVSRGLQDLLTQRLASGHTAYEETVAKWQGDISLTFTPKRETTVLPSGNNPAWDTIEGPVIGDVELKLYDLPLADMPELLGVQYSAADGVCVGEGEPVYLGLSFNRLVKKDGVESYNKTILYKVRFDLPEVSPKTIEEGDNAVGDITLKGKAYPVFFNKTSGAQGTRTYCIVNSVSNATKYTANATQIVYPTEMTPDTPVVVSGGGSGGSGGNGGTTV